MSMAEERRKGERRKGERRQDGERRTDVRLPIELWTEEVKGDDVVYRRTGNISVGGVFFDQAIPYPVGKALSIKIPLPDTGQEVVAAGEVVGVLPEEVGMRVKFTKFDGDGQEKLKEFLEKTLK
jgi:hypothetical protein